MPSIFTARVNTNKPVNLGNIKSIKLQIGEWPVPQLMSGLFDGSKQKKAMYQIGHGFIELINGSKVKITRTTNAMLYYIISAIKDLDYPYCWISRMKFGIKYQVCFRYIPHCQTEADNIITDIRLCGICVNILTAHHAGKPGAKYGFIQHALFRNNLYFRTTDIDRSPHMHGMPNMINVGDWVAFRVGDPSCGSGGKRGTRRNWALRIYKL